MSTEALRSKEFRPNLASGGNLPLTFNLPSEVTLTRSESINHQVSGHASESSGLENTASCFCQSDQGCVYSHNSELNMNRFLFLACKRANRLKCEFIQVMSVIYNVLYCKSIAVFLKVQFVT